MSRMIKSCDCGNIEVEFIETEGLDVARKCGCEYCVMQNAEYVSNPLAQVTFTIHDKKKHKIIHHGFKSAEFHECTNCGLILVTCSIEDGVYCTLNAVALGVKGYVLENTVKDFSGETLSERLSRRKANWCRMHENS